MLHEQVETDILGKEVSVSYSLVVLAERTWVHLYLNLSLVCVVRLSDEEPWHWESLLHDVFRILHWCLKQCFEIFEIRVCLVICLLPFINGIAFPNADIEECIKQKYDIILHRVNIKENWSSLL